MVKSYNVLVEAISNKNDNEYVYMAWAESPYHNLYGGQPRAM